MYDDTRPFVHTFCLSKTWWNSKSVLSLRPVYSSNSLLRFCQDRPLLADCQAVPFNINNSVTSHFQAGLLVNLSVSSRVQLVKKGNLVETLHWLTGDISLAYPIFSHRSTSSPYSTTRALKILSEGSDYLTNTRFLRHRWMERVWGAKTQYDNGAVRLLRELKNVMRSYLRCSSSATSLSAFQRAGTVSQIFLARCI